MYNNASDLLYMVNYPAISDIFTGQIKFNKMMKSAVCADMLFEEDKNNVV